jgi:hypothetical protein
VSGDVFLEDMGGVGGDGHVAIDVVCRLCGGRYRLIPDESFVLQVQAFLEHHRH